jgi:hypothetical protein
VGHPGLNNPFHVKHMRLEVAVLYNDVSVLEHSHASHAWRLLTRPEHDVFANVSEAETAAIRQTHISMILGTDMSTHFDDVAKFSAKTAAGGLQVGSDADTRFILRMALHSADVSNAAKGPELCMPWAVRVMDEFFMQVRECARAAASSRAATPPRRPDAELSWCRGLARNERCASRAPRAPTTANVLAPRPRLARALRA